MCEANRNLCFTYEQKFVSFFISFILNYRNLILCSCELAVPLCWYLTPIIISCECESVLDSSRTVVSITKLLQSCLHVLSIILSDCHKLHKELYEWPKLRDCDGSYDYFRMGCTGLQNKAYKYRGHSETGFRTYASIQGVRILCRESRSTSRISRNCNGIIKTFISTIHSSLQSSSASINKCFNKFSMIMTFPINLERSLRTIWTPCLHCFHCQRK